MVSPSRSPNAFVVPFTLTGSISRARSTVSCCHGLNLYADIGLPSGNSSTSLNELKSAYRALVRQSHPDSSTGEESDEFTAAATAWAILSDPSQRAAYDAMGWAGVSAIASIEERAAKARALGLDQIEAEAELLASEGTLDFSLLSAAPASQDMRPPSASEHDDACPRSIEEAIWNIEHHEDESTRYYTLWWVYRFRVVQAEKSLVWLLKLSTERSTLKRRGALALGVIAQVPGVEGERSEVVSALMNCMQSSDYYLRYRAAEALTVIAQQHARDPRCAFAPSVLDGLVGFLRTGLAELERKRAAKSGYDQQESLFDLDSLDPEVAEKLRHVFASRRENEKRSRRTTMTPQLGVDEVDAKVDQPYEWILKAVGAIGSLSKKPTDDIVEVVKGFVGHDTPLIRYAAHKALYILTGDEQYAQALIEALEYGVEHHYTQRVLIRDLGDVGYAAGARAVAQCQMVENSFKVLALKNMLAKRDNNPADEAVREVMVHMDSLL